MLPMDVTFSGYSIVWWKVCPPIVVPGECSRGLLGGHYNFSGRWWHIGVAVLNYRVTTWSTSMLCYAPFRLPSVIVRPTRAHSNMSFTWTKIFLLGSVVCPAFLARSIDSLSSLAPNVRFPSVVRYLLPLISRGRICNSGERYWAAFRIVILPLFQNYWRALLWTWLEKLVPYLLASMYNIIVYIGSRHRGFKIEGSRHFFR